MVQAGQQVRFAAKLLDRQGKFLRGQAAHAHLFDSHQAISKLSILSHIDRSHATLSHGLQQTVALAQRASRRQPACAHISCWL